MVRHSGARRVLRELRNPSPGAHPLQLSAKKAPDGIASPPTSPRVMGDTPLFLIKAVSGELCKKKGSVPYSSAPPQLEPAPAVQPKQ